MALKPHEWPLNRRRTNVQQLTCNIDLSCTFYYMFFCFVLFELKPLALKGKVPDGKSRKTPLASPCAWKRPIEQNVPSNWPNAETQNKITTHTQWFGSARRQIILLSYFSLRVTHRGESVEKLELLLQLNIRTNVCYWVEFLAMRCAGGGWSGCHGSTFVVRRVLLVSYLQWLT